MNINTNDKKGIKTFITTYLSLQAVFAIVLITIMIVFGTMILKEAMHIKNDVESRIYKKNTE